MVIQLFWNIVPQRTFDCGRVVGLGSGFNLHDWIRTPREVWARINQRAQESLRPLGCAPQEWVVGVVRKRGGRGGRLGSVLRPTLIRAPLAEVRFSKQGQMLLCGAGRVRIGQTTGDQGFKLVEVRWHCGEAGMGCFLMLRERVCGSILDCSTSTTMFVAVPLARGRPCLYFCCRLKHRHSHVDGEILLLSLWLFLLLLL